MCTVAHCQKIRLDRVIDFGQQQRRRGPKFREMYPCDLQRFIVSSGALNLIQQFLEKSANVSKTAQYAGWMLP
jgi:hypothetical protein